MELILMKKELTCDFSILFSEDERRDKLLLEVVL